MKKLISTMLAIVIVLSLATNPAFAASSVSEFTDDDYVNIHPNDYYTLRDKSNPFTGVSWNEGAKVIFGESKMYGGIPGAKKAGVWSGSPAVDKSVTSVKFPSSVVILGFMLFDGRDEITSVNFEELVNLKHIGTSAFNRVKIKTADLSNTKVISIDDGAFMTGAYPSLKSFTAPSTLKRIGSDVFANQTWLNRVNLNEGLEIIGDRAFQTVDVGFVIPSTVKEIGKNALNPSRTYRVYKDSYAEQYCKDNSIKYIYTDNSIPTTPTTTTTPTTPTTTELPKMVYTKTLGPVTFSNYVSHQEVTPWDANDKPINVTWVKISENGCMRADNDNTEFIFNCFDSWNTPKNDAVYNGRTGINFGSYRNETLEKWCITPYPTVKTNGTWSKGLTWQFAYNRKFGDLNDNNFDITVEVDGQKYYYAVSVVKDKPAGSPASIPPAKNAVATPTSSKVLVNGKVVSFDAYTINGNNYFKLRDIAQIISGTEKQFDVTWTTVTRMVLGANGNTTEKIGVIELLSDQAYKTVGEELIAGDGKAKDAALCTSPIHLDGREINLTAYTINGNNYFKLRDLGDTFDFNVTWYAENNAVVIDTTQRYAAD